MCGAPRSREHRRLDLGPARGGDRPHLGLSHAREGHVRAARLAPQPLVGVDSELRLFVRALLAAHGLAQGGARVARDLEGGPAEGEDADEHLAHVAAVEEVLRVEELVTRHAERLGCVEEPRDVLALLEHAELLLDALHATRLDDVHQLAEQHAALEQALEAVVRGLGIELLAEHVAHPREHLLMDAVRVLELVGALVARRRRARPRGLLLLNRQRV
mmetsp:Transcript_8924/g.30331  ORF Transcript_8924/g.30331 Transcript_8924/m.30331 type:complete len:217 (+) Transcript_8924:308-958(+)